jgi:16S rRNA (uracil1498-N3)-methyltransferase
VATPSTPAGRAAWDLGRWFFLAEAGDGRFRLHPDDERHAAKVLRLSRGDPLVGLDGRGGVWPLSVASVERTGVALEPRGAELRLPRAGEPGSELPRVELAACVPQGARAEDLLDRLVQLGVDRVTWLFAERSQGDDRQRRPRTERWERVAREACKQARRAWLPEIRGPQEAAELLRAEPGGTTVLASPRAERKLVELVRDGATAGLRILVGPEGGWTAGEEARMVGLGAQPAAIGPLLLRVETAAEAAAAITLHAAWRP